MHTVLGHGTLKRLQPHSPAVHRFTSLHLTYQLPSPCWVCENKKENESLGSSTTTVDECSAQEAKMMYCAKQLMYFAQSLGESLPWTFQAMVVCLVSHIYPLICSSPWCAIYGSGHVKCTTNIKMCPVRNIMRAGTVRTGTSWIRGKGALLQVHITYMPRPGDASWNLCPAPASVNCLRFNFRNVITFLVTCYSTFPLSQGQMEALLEFWMFMCSRRRVWGIQVL